MAAAASVLCARVVVQIELGREEVIKLAKASLEALPRKVERLDIVSHDSKLHGPPLPVKPQEAAATKTNIRFGDALRGLLKVKPDLHGRLVALAGHLRGMYDDQGACVVLTALALHDIDQPVETALRLVKDSVGAKQLSNVLKSLGANGHELGSRLVEGDTLQGKGVNAIDLRAKAAERVAPPGSAGTLPEIDEGQLRQAVRDVLAEELGDKAVVFEDVDSFWRRRWAWCVNGGHSRALEHAEEKYKVTGLPGRVHRRVAAEAWDFNVVKEWSGTVYVTASEKLEPGKGRLLLAGDTATYVCFEHFLRPIEKAWRNRRVVLEPGSKGHLGMSNKVLGLSKGRNTWVMLDYDDFNSQHTLTAQKVVIEEAGRVSGYDQDLLNKLVASFDKMLVYAEGDLLGKMTATLASGHRGTTFLNSVLNAAYVRCAAGPLYSQMRTLHVGDDVVCAVTSFQDVEPLLDGCRRLGLRMNPMKMSVGHVGAEFLRMAIRDGYTTGYVLRAIASSVAGNWVNPEELGPRGVIQTMVSNCRTLINRSRQPLFADLMARSVRRRAGISDKRARELLSGEVALTGGPTFANTRIYRSLEVEEVKGLEAEAISNLPRYATQDYLERHVTLVEQTALEVAQLSPVPHMLESSYRKTLTSDGSVVHRLVVREREAMPKTALGSEPLGVALRRSDDMCRGLLTGYPLVYLVKNHLRGEGLNKVLALAGWDGVGSPEVAAWGAQAEGAIIEGVASYSDAAAATRRTKTGVLVSLRPTYM